MPGAVEANGEPAAAFAHQGEVHLLAHRADVRGSHVGILGRAIGDHRLGDPRQDGAHMGIVHAQHGHPVEGQALHEVHEGLLELLEVVAIGFHVVRVDVGHHRDHRHQVEEGGIGLVRLGHQEFAAAQAGVGAGRLQPAADDEGGIQSPFGQHARDQAGGGGLAMGAGHRDPLLEAHELRQHQRPWHHRDVAFPRRHHFRVVRFHGGGGHHHVGLAHVAGVVAAEDLGAQLGQPARHRVVRQVGAAHLEAQVEQHLGDAAHAGAPDAHEMDVFDPVFHLSPSPRCGHRKSGKTTRSCRQLLAHRGDCGGGLRLRQRARLAGHVRQGLPRKAPQQPRHRFRRELGLG